MVAAVVAEAAAVDSVAADPRADHLTGEPEIWVPMFIVRQHQQHVLNVPAACARAVRAKVAYMRAGA